MTPTSVPPTTFNSFNRRRASSEESYCYSACVSSSSNVSIHSLPETRLREEEDIGRYSPRAAVAGRLGQLAIRADPISTPQFVDSRIEQTSIIQPLHTYWASPDHHGIAALNYSGVSQICGNGLSTVIGEGNSYSNTEIENDESKNTTTTEISSGKQSYTSPRKKRNPLFAPKLRSQRRSPPLSSSPPENPLTWHDSEITGHNPTDPNDDGYGINGLGFKPTASIAWTRSQKRQKQVAEWRIREAKEARERRREKRDGIELDKIRTIQKGAIQKKVKFDI
ncbi:uncharacterized protein ATNIH1004_007485 [Aspergillus tanneri]|uniref:Uncharacterized protein n=1 Tax=Aspergillus tanneri TaxID=1220188 RepID=A0A5M9MGG3_9EURO|nr:uncharacterized protein ATNIH1004_007485 [Aspergillus tanneri]KAA8646062.1 hypothetical protein ATNIH1004_007485 [Aspergillus tanneri]